MYENSKNTNKASQAENTFLTSPETKSYHAVWTTILKGGNNKVNLNWKKKLGENVCCFCCAWTKHDNQSVCFLHPLKKMSLKTKKQTQN